VPIELQQPKTRVQRLIDEQRSQHGGSTTRSTARSNLNRRSYYYGEEPTNRVQSEPPRKSKQQVEQRSRWQNEAQMASHKRAAPPLYRTELLKTSNKMYEDETESVINRRNWRHELSKSYHDISRDIKHQQQQQTMGHAKLEPKDTTQSYNELPKPSQLFGWSDEFQWQHNYKTERGRERSDGVQRSKSFAIGSDNSHHTHSASSTASSNILRYHQQQKKTKSYKDTKVSKAEAIDRFFPEPPKEFGGFATDIQKKYNEAKQSLHSKKQTTKKQKTADAVYEFERKIPMQSSILEAQKFKTVIFVSGN